MVEPPFVPGQFDPSTDGVGLEIHDGGPVITLGVPGGLPGTGCGLRDGWHIRPGVQSYKNVSGALPPGCAAGSAQGLRMAVDGTMGVSVATRGSTLPPITGPPLSATVSLGLDPAATTAGCCGAVTFSQSRPSRTGFRFVP